MGSEFLSLFGFVDQLIKQEQPAAISPIAVEHAWRRISDEADRVEFLLASIHGRLFQLRKGIYQGTVDEQELEQAREYLIGKFAYLKRVLTVAAQETYVDGAGI